MTFNTARSQRTEQDSQVFSEQTERLSQRNAILESRVKLLQDALDQRADEMGFGQKQGHQLVVMSELSSKLRDLEEDKIALLNALDDMHTELETVHNELSKTQRTKTGAMTRTQNRDDLEQQMEEQIRINNTLRTQVEQLQTQIIPQSYTPRTQRSQADDLDVNQILAFQEDLLRELTKQKDEIVTLTEELRSKEIEKKQEHARANDLSNIVNILKEQLEKQRIQHETSTITSSEHYETTKQQYSVEKNRIEEELKEMKQEVNTFLQSRERNEQELNRLRSAVNELTQNLNQTEENYRSLEIQNAKIKVERDQAIQSSSDERKEREHYQKLYERMSTESQGREEQLKKEHRRDQEDLRKENAILNDTIQTLVSQIDSKERKWQEELDQERKNSYSGQSKEEELKNRCSELTTQLKSSQNEIDLLRRTLSDNETKIREINEEWKKKEQDAELTRITRFGEEKKILEQRLAAKDEENSDLRKRVMELDKQRRDAEQATEDMRETLKEKEEKVCGREGTATREVNTILSRSMTTENRVLLQKLQIKEAEAAESKQTIQAMTAEKEELIKDQSEKEEKWRAERNSAELRQNLQDQQIKQLQTQLEEAKEDLANAETELRQIEADLSGNNTGWQEESTVTSNQRHLTLSPRRERALEMMKGRHDMKEAVDELRRELSAVSQELTETKQKLDAAVREKEDMKRRMEIEHKLMISETAKAKQMQFEMDDREKDVEAERGRLADGAAELANLRAECERLKDQLRRMELTESEMKREQKRLEEARLEMEQLLSSEKSQQTKKEDTQPSNSVRESERESEIQGLKLELGSTRRAAQNKEATLQIEIEGLKGEVKVLEVTVKRKEEEKAKLRAENDELRDSVARLSRMVKMKDNGDKTREDDRTRREQHLKEEARTMEETLDRTRRLSDDLGIGRTDTGTTRRVFERKYGRDREDEMSSPSSGVVTLTSQSTPPLSTSRVLPTSSSPVSARHIISSRPTRQPSKSWNESDLTTPAPPITHTARTTRQAGQPRISFASSALMTPRPDSSKPADSLPLSPRPSHSILRPSNQPDPATAFSPERQTRSDMKARNAALSKRKKGMTNKAQQLCKLTGAEIVMSIIPPSGEVFFWSSPGLERFWYREEVRVALDADYQESKKSSKGQVMPLTINDSQLPPQYVMGHMSQQMSLNQDQDDTGTPGQYILPSQFQNYYSELQPQYPTMPKDGISISHPDSSFEEYLQNAQATHPFDEDVSGDEGEKRAKMDGDGNAPSIPRTYQEQTHKDEEEDEEEDEEYKAMQEQMNQVKQLKQFLQGQ
ncbi:hypothetical protein BLNAU_4607 [Blattamonas nauphoetae]|uniref:MADS-box domain-containing protein n=1 Tax=Blattamonas nauphoetae TaxID=2049346 RepID=A0ABQ9Y9I1_9EUKA|nr:hypothetical protein BLNAU_4607 [Blattamonas nauphoetae]